MGTPGALYGQPRPHNVDRCDASANGGRCLLDETHVVEYGSSHTFFDRNGDRVVWVDNGPTTVLPGKRRFECAWCGDHFDVDDPAQRYCSHECRLEGRNSSRRKWKKKVE